MNNEITITGVGSELQGVGRAADGRTLFVPGALPGERVTVRVAREGNKFSTAQVLQILEPSVQRAEPPCPHAGACGGCSAQHMTYGLSLELKRRKVSDALRRIGGLQDVEVSETIPSPQLWRYRNKAEYGCRFAGGQPLIGVTQRATHNLIDVDDCLLQHEASVRFVRAARENLHSPSVTQLVTRVNTDGQLMGVIGCSSQLADERLIADALFCALPELASLYRCDLKPRPTHALDGPCHLIRGQERLEERLFGLRYELSPHSFFQVNRPQAENLMQTLLQALNLRGGETVVDAYCGIGTLTLPIAHVVKRAIGIEIVAPAIEDARRAAQQNHIQNAEFICGDSSQQLASLLKRGIKPDVVVVDPPRKGIDAALNEQLLRCRPQKIGYVSCDPATLARDIKLLTATGAYRLGKVQPLDMFPWTEHVECVVLMSKVE